MSATDLAPPPLAGTPRGRDELLVAAPVERVWAILTDSRRLPEWAPPVEAVTGCEDEEAPGATRRCAVRIGGRPGEMVERCVEAVPLRRLSYVVDEDSFGFARRFADYGFTLSLTPCDGGTAVALQTFYDARGPFGAAMDTLLLRRQLGRVRRELLAGLARLAAGSPP
jgi:uncharacterized protein YndB with AHSA1/START domain